MKSKNVIAIVAALLLYFASGSLGAAETMLKQEFDSLFVIASSGEVKFQDMVEPAIDSIAALGEDIVPLLIDRFTTKSARERWTVVNILKKIGAPSIPYLVRALRRPDGLIVQRVCWALGDVGDSTAVEPLMAVCSNRRWQVRDQAIGALGKIGEPRASEAVSLALSDQIGHVRKAAAVACGRLGINRSVQKLSHLLGDDFYGARMSAMQSLLKMDTAAVMQVLADSIDSENDLLGDIACYILGQYGTLPALSILMGQTQSFDPDRRAHAAVAVIQADPEDSYGFHQFLFDREDDRFVLLKMRSSVYSATYEQREPED